MKPTGNRFVWDSQETAERVAQERLNAHLDLLRRLAELNETLDSHKLYELIVDERLALS